MNTAMATCLLDLLDKVPTDARLSYEHSPTHHQMIQVGGLAREAALRIRELEAERDTLRELVREIANNVHLDCDNVHHRKRDQGHPISECPVVARLRARIDAALERVKPSESGIRTDTDSKEGEK